MWKTGSGNKNVDRPQKYHKYRRLFAITLNNFEKNKKYLFEKVEEFH